MFESIIEYIFKALLYKQSNLLRIILEFIIIIEIKTFINDK